MNISAEFQASFITTGIYSNRYCLVCVVSQDLMNIVMVATKSNEL